MTGSGVSICRGGCRPVWRGTLRECPDCGDSVRVTVLRDPPSDADPGVEAR